MLLSVVIPFFGVFVGMWVKILVVVMEKTKGRKQRQINLKSLKVCKKKIL